MHPFWCILHVRRICLFSIKLYVRKSDVLLNNPFLRGSPRPRDFCHLTTLDVWFVDHPERIVCFRQADYTNRPAESNRVAPNDPVHPVKIAGSKRK